MTGWRTLTIPRSTPPALDPARRAQALSGLMPPDQTVAVLEALLDAGRLDLIAARTLDEYAGVYPGGIGPAQTRALQTELPRLRAAVDFDPADNRSLSQYIQALHLQARIEATPVPRDEISARHAALFALSPYDGETWASYGRVMADSMDMAAVTLDEVARIRGYFENALFFGNHGVTSLFYLDGYNQTIWLSLDKRNIDAVDVTGETAFARAEFDAAVVCPAVRANRVLAAVCAEVPDSDGCSRPGDPTDPGLALIARAERRQACAAALQAPARTLGHAPVAEDLPEGE